MSCPYSSPQNGKAEHIIRSTNNVVRSLLFQTSLPPSFLVEALQTTTYLINILPTQTLQKSTPHLALFGKAPTYDHLRVFSCKCYPNLSSTAPHKLSPRSTLCVFLGYSVHHKRYHCLGLSSNRLIISRHVIFDESAFPYAKRGYSPLAANFEFLDATDFVPAPIGVVPKFLAAGSSSQPYAAAPGAGPAVHDALPAGPLLSNEPPPMLDASLLPAQTRAASASLIDGAHSPLPDSPAPSPTPQPRGPPPGFAPLPQHPAPATWVPSKCVITQVYTRRPRPAAVPNSASTPATTTLAPSATSTPSATSSAPAPLPKGVVDVPPVTN